MSETTGTGDKDYNRITDEEILELVASGPYIPSIRGEFVIKDAKGNIVPGYNHKITFRSAALAKRSLIRKFTGWRCKLADAFLDKRFGQAFYTNLDGYPTTEPPTPKAFWNRDNREKAAYDPTFVVDALLIHRVLTIEQVE